MKKLQVSLLGELRLCIDNTEVVLPKSRKARALLAYVVYCQKPVCRARLSEFLFSDTSDPKGNLRWCLSRLKAALASVDNSLIRSDSSQIWTTIPPECVDALRLNTVCQQEIFGVEELEFLETATRGTFLPNLTLAHSHDFEAWRVMTQSKLNSMLEDTLNKAVENNMGSDDATKFARLFVNFAPDLEVAWFLLVTALAKAGKMSKARKMLHSAVAQLDSNEGVLSGLLEQAASSLDNKCDKSDVEKFLSKDSSVATDKPSIYIRSLNNNSDPVYQEIQNGLSDMASLCKSFRIVCFTEAPDQETLVAETDFVLVPTVTSSDKTYQLNLQLIDGSSKACIDRWQVSLVPPVTDQLKSWLAERLELDMQMMMSVLAYKKPDTNCNSIDYYYRALPRIYSPVGYSADEAMALLKKSLQINPNSGPALCALAWVRSTHPRFNDDDETRAETAKMARRAIEFSYDDACIIGWAAMTIGHLELNARTGLNFARFALDINPYSPLATVASALMSHYCCKYRQSIQYLDRLAERGIEPLGFSIDACYAINYYQLGHLSKARSFGQRAVVRNPGMVLCLRALVVSLARSGELEEARKLAKKMVELDSTEYIQYFEKFSLYTKVAARKKLCEDLEKAGVPYFPRQGNISHHAGAHQEPRASA